LTMPEVSEVKLKLWKTIRSQNLPDSPLQTIGKSFNRYHATALHSIGIVERGLKEKGALQRQVEILSNKLESGKF
ncbi:MAG: hypothetical protein KKC23_03875, partial [Proteobacteria bacterium]|nr:hypothetical protein [Pseudomonadota bacterium]